jgi:hypothetical protein
MSTELQGAINVLVSRVDQKSKELIEMKRMVNQLCREIGQAELYSDADLQDRGSARPNLDPDQYYGKPPVTAAREYLERRGKAVPLDEILDALERGGFDFDAQGWSESQRLRHLGSSLGKNSVMFHRLPNDTWGLVKWYPNVVKERKRARPNGKQEAASTVETETDTEEQTKTTDAK